MPVDLSIKHVPDEIARRLRRRAEQNHRSLQGELMAILHAAVAPPDRAESIAREVQATYTPSKKTRVAARSESALMIRQAREGRTFTVQDLYEYVDRLGIHTPAEATEWIRQERTRR